MNVVNIPVAEPRIVEALHGVVDVQSVLALVVDLMFHVSSGLLRFSAIASASTVLPVPGSPRIKSGFSSAQATLTASRSSGVTRYVSVPVKR